MTDHTDSAALTARVLAHLERAGGDTLAGVQKFLARPLSADTGRHRVRHALLRLRRRGLVALELDPEHGAFYVKVKATTHDVAAPAPGAIDPEAPAATTGPEGTE